MMQAEPQRAQYLVWVLQGNREGDNAQARALAERLGAAFVLKRIVWSSFHLLPNVIRRAGLLAVDRQRSDSLAPPWPDAVIAVGRRTAPISVWIKRQSEGRTRLIHLGRPRFPLDWFDLIITTPQYALPDGPNVVKSLLPLTNAVLPPVDGKAWELRFAPLPRPWTGVLVGGSVFPFRFGRAEALTLTEKLKDYWRKTQGSLLISTSPRTGKDVADILAVAVGPHGYVHRWVRGTENPHRFILSAADRFIVTEDSASMLAEACRSRKPVEIDELPRFPVPLFWHGRSGPAAFLARAGLLSPPRQTRRLRKELIRRGHARLLGDASPHPFVPYEDEWGSIAARIDVLLQSSAHGQ
jgi:mitochondrial fission protein ELM1